MTSMNKPVRDRTFPKWLCLVTLLFAFAAPTHANDAQIVLLVGRAEYQETAQGLWQRAVLEQPLVAGTALRTSVASQLALLLRDQTQLRINEQTQIRITGVAGEQDGTTIELARGRRG